MCPNWCNGYVKISGKPEDVKNFCKLFIFEDEADKDEKKGKYFARSFIYQKYEDFEKANLGKGEVEFCVDFAWSSWSCLIEGYPQENRRKCITLKSACKKYNVEVEITTEEPAMGFEETIIADKNDIKYSSKDMPLYECVCGSKQSVPSDSDLNEIECYDCERMGEGKIK
jgi:hypothetical protein